MIAIRPASERGVANHGWLDSRHTFSFASYYDPAHMGFGKLRVINEDKVAPGAGFDTHGHGDMEIVSYVLDGVLAHKDNIGNGSEIRPGDVQRMSAGTGILHGEYNHSPTDPVHFLQIWILPDTTGLEPSYEQVHFPAAEKQGNLRLVGSRDGREGSVTIHQDVDLYATLLGTNETVTFLVRDDRHAWIQVARGSVRASDRVLTAGDGAAVTEPTELALTGLSEDAEVLLFDLAQ